MGSGGIPLPPPGGIPVPPPIPQTGSGGVPLPPPGGIPVPPPIMNNAIKQPVKPAAKKEPFKPKPKPMSLAEEIALRKSALKKVEVKEPKSAALRKPGEEPPSSGGGNDMRSQLMNIFKAKKGFDFSKFDKK